VRAWIRIYPLIHADWRRLSQKPRHDVMQLSRTLKVQLNAPGTYLANPLKGTMSPGEAGGHRPS